MSQKVFVYGTLRRGERAEHLMAGAQWMGFARTAPGFRLISMGWYPAMIAIPQTVGAVAVEGIAPSGVIGEIYDVPEAMIPALDAYEDVPHLYTRVPVPLSEGALPSAMAYLLRPEHSAGRPVIPSGDWCRRTPGS